MQNAFPEEPTQTEPQVPEVEVSFKSVLKRVYVWTKILSSRQNLLFHQEKATMEQEKEHSRTKNATAKDEEANRKLIEEEKVQEAARKTTRVQGKARPKNI